MSRGPAAALRRKAFADEYSAIKLLLKVMRVTAALISRRRGLGGSANGLLRRLHHCLNCCRSSYASSRDCLAMPRAPAQRGTPPTR